MERSDEARRKDALYDEIFQKNRRIKELEIENERLKSFALKLVETEEELQQLDYWAEEYLHAYDQLAGIRYIAAEYERLKSRYKIYESLWEKAENGECDGDCEGWNTPYGQCPICIARLAINEAKSIVYDAFCDI